MAKDRLCWCEVTVATNGVATARYRWSSSEVDGLDSVDEDVSSWTDDEIRDAVAGIVGIDQDDKDRIEVTWD